MERCESDGASEQCEAQAEEEISACFDACEEWDWGDEDAEDSPGECDETCLDDIEDREARCAESEDPERCFERLWERISACMEACEEGYEEWPDHEERPRRADHEERPDHMKSGLTTKRIRRGP